MDVQVITVTSKGQIAIPTAIRKHLHIKSGDKLVAYSSDDSILLKVIKIPSSEEMKQKFDEAAKWASSVGMKESDITEAISSVRKNK